MLAKTAATTLQRTAVRRARPLSARSALAIWVCMDSEAARRVGASFIVARLEWSGQVAGWRGVFGKPRAASATAEAKC